MGKKRSRNKKPSQNTNESYEIIKDNQALVEFYKMQKIIPEDEWDQFENILKTPLPSSFRIQLSLPERDLVLKYMQDKFFVELNRIAESENNDGVTVPKPLSFVPYAFQTDMPRTALRSNPVLKHMHEFLVNQAVTGNISRQEAVSMVPPLLLDIKSDHLVLDACASPGSKTMQIIELMHKDNPNPEGLIVANDLSYERCYLLVHQTLKRLPTANCVVVNHDASLMPAILDSEKKPMLYDRILCDVICSGDGTFRKNLDLWKTWDPSKGINLHKVQKQIAIRCLRLLKVGGLMAYSTCSLNPMEDEAVVAHILRTFGNEVELVDVSDQLPGLKRSPGISTWKVIAKSLEVINSYDEAQGQTKSFLSPSMFPPTAEEAVHMHLERTFRILPHAQNTGGFFVAIIRKKRDFAEELHLDQPPRKPMQKKRKTFREDPFVFLDGNMDEFKQKMTTYYGLSESFPYENLLVRTHNTEKKNGIYFVNDQLRRMLKNNGDRFKVVNAGIAVLRSVDKKEVTPVLEISENDFIQIVQGMEDLHYTPLEKLENPEAFSKLECGSVLLRCTKGDFRKDIVCWMGAKTASAFIVREEKIHILNMLDADSTKLSKALLSARQEKAQNARTKTEGNDQEPTEDDLPLIKEEENGTLE
ncbi:16S rRNA methyltransferase rsmB/F domain-containing protein [Ditylenchus destructor]|uniref:tRNA (cytosine(34)-C(5))-methyltransferase n=1 Tax=Ditylenchus destructor TaxID=166010 RepID=A0AAD4R8R8_9BILA|nr:16S rRNA methyltransferase rsmB/F domain-containing protein [Ditylenchus destructor]